MFEYLVIILGMCILFVMFLTLCGVAYCIYQMHKFKTHEFDVNVPNVYVQEVDRY